MEVMGIHVEIFWSIRDIGVWVSHARDSPRSCRVVDKKEIERPCTFWTRIVLCSCGNRSHNAYLYIS